MNTYRLAVSQRAEHDADVIYNWLAARSADGAARWYRVLRATLHGLTENPQGFSRAPEADLLNRDIQQALFKTPRGHTYRALFIVSEDTVHVLAVRGFGQGIAGSGDLEFPD